MKKRILLLSGLILTAMIIVIPQIIREFRETLTGEQEVPVVSTSGRGDFRARITGDTISYQLSYTNLEGNITQAHIHLGQEDVNGGISVWLCSNLASPPTPAGTQPCPPSPATIFGNITAGNVVGPANQGIDPGEFNELVKAMRGGNTYVNVHTSKFPGGEIRQQINHRDDHRSSDSDSEPR
jgi:hypothetical protein